MPLGTGLFLWLRDNEYARWIVGGGLVAAIILLWDKMRTTRIKREATAKANRKAEKQSKAILKDMEQESNDRIEAAREARERVDDDVSSDSLSDGARSVLFGSRSDSGGGGGY